MRTTGPLSAPASATANEWSGMGVAGGSGPVHSPHLRRRPGLAAPSVCAPAGGRWVMPSIPNPIDIIGQGLGGSLADLAESAFNQAMKGLWDFSLSLLKGVLGVIDHLTLPNLDPATGPLSSVMPATIWVGGVLLVLLSFVLIMLTPALAIVISIGFKLAASASAGGGPASADAGQQAGPAFIGAAVLLISVFCPVAVEEL